METLWKADRFLLLSESIQGMRDGSFGPLNTGRNDIRIITNAIRHYSRGVWFLERGKKYIKAWFQFFAKIRFLNADKIFESVESCWKLSVKHITIFLETFWMPFPHWGTINRPWNIQKIKFVTLFKILFRMRTIHHGQWRWCVKKAEFIISYTFYNSWRIWLMKV